MHPPSFNASPRTWVIPANDLEALEIRALLETRRENIHVTRQAWGATWAGLEIEIQNSLESFLTRFPHGQIFGVELAGPNPFHARNIDHHKYSTEDRSAPTSSLEQIAVILNIALSPRQTLIALNDRGYIPAMMRAGATAQEIAEIRALDRAAQGITAEDEAAAEEDIRSRAEWYGSRVLIHCHGLPTSAHFDRLFGKADEILVTAPAEWSYSGPRHGVLAALSLPEEYWSGGSPASGYFGISQPSPQSQSKILAVFQKPPETSPQS